MVSLTLFVADGLASSTGVKKTSMPAVVLFASEQAEDLGDTAFLWHISNLTYRPFVNRKANAYKSRSASVSERFLFQDPSGDEIKIEIVCTFDCSMYTSVPRRYASSFC